MSRAENIQKKPQDNLVNFPGVLSEKEKEDIPLADEILEDILGEFDDILNEPETESLLEAEELLAQESVYSADDVLHSIESQMRQLRETNQRLKFFLDEIESFVSTRK